jgi:EAL domain-containing protein (putative c-di-GMP-specific phosphodiesterase class I)/GGDEF domain-containing protein
MTAYIAPTKDNEQARLNALRDLNLLDSPPSESYDRLTRLASKLLDAPVSTISLTDADRQWFKSRVGVDLVEIPRAQAPCSYAIGQNDVFVVPDLLEDSRFADSPLAQAGIRFYAGAPLFTRSGHGLGTLCVVDAKVRDLSEDERQVLSDLARMVMSQVELQNMIGRVDATTGVANQHQMFEDIEDMARRDPSGRCTGILLDLVSARQSGQGQRVLGSDYSEALMRGAFERIRPRLGNTARLYHVGTTRCVVVLTPEFGGDETAMQNDLRALLSDPIHCNGIPIQPSPIIGNYAFVCGEVAPRDVLRRLFNAVEDAEGAENHEAAYSAAHDLKAARSFLLLNDFKAALEANDQLSLAYQPRVDMKTGRCAGVEALIRWTHPTLGPIPPMDFIPAVEQTALVRPLTDWVVNEALAQIRRWSASGIELKVSINVSALNLDETGFSARLLAAIEASGVSPTALELEFTESAVARDSGRVVDQLQTVRDAGLDVAIDDFGTGYSNLSYLQELPATVLKIDRAFVFGLEDSPRNQRLVQTIIKMAHDLRYSVVAEGIESQAAYDILAAWGCDEGQGYLMAKPMPAQQLTRWLAENTGGSATRISA